MKGWALAGNKYIFDVVWSTLGQQRTLEGGRARQDSIVAQASSIGSREQKRGWGRKLEDGPFSLDLSTHWGDVGSMMGVTRWVQETDIRRQGTLVPTFNCSKLQEYNCHH